MLLEVKNIRVTYGSIPAIYGVSFRVNSGEIVCIVGSNGVGKSTLLKAISGLEHPVEGEIVFEDKRIDRLLPHDIVKLGISYVPEGKRIFFRVTVEENLILGSFIHKDKSKRAENLEYVYSLFPRLEERNKQKAGTLSGGEQQMLAIARGLMSKPKLLMLDEPSLGIMPKLVDKIFEAIEEISKTGMTILLVEQNVREALELANRAYILQTGKIILEGQSAELLESDMVRKAYMGL
jgi:branched-chain amino acid transport system ATP-binding protein